MSLSIRVGGDIHTSASSHSHHSITLTSIFSQLTADCSLLTPLALIAYSVTALTMGSPTIVVWRRDRCTEGHYLLGLLFTAATGLLQ